MTTITRITNDEAAKTWLAENDLTPTLVDGKVVESAACGRCGGSGNGGWFQDGGVCYDCGGRDTSKCVTRISVKAFAQREKGRVTRANKASAARAARHEARLDSQRDYSEKHGNGRLTFAELDEKRATDRRAEALTKTHVGEVKVRGTFDLTLLFTRSFDGQYGLRVLHAFADQDGNRVTWWTTDWLSYEGSTGRLVKGDRFIVKATVKEHGDYEGAPQTTVTRLKVESVVELAPRD